MITPVNTQAGKFGIIKDVPPYALPPEAWSDGQNVRVKEGSIQKFLGHKSVFGTPTVAPYWMIPVQTSSTYFWLYCSLTKAYVTDGVIHTDLTRLSGGDYIANADGGWNGIVMGGIPIINNGLDDPQMWNPVQTTQKLLPLSNWPANTKAKVIRSYKTHALALNVTKTATPFPRLVKWSHPAAFNTVPSSWDETDDTLDAGEYELADTRGDLIDGLQLRDSFILYKDDAIWGMQYIGAPHIFRFYRISATIGALSRRCIQEFENHHFVFGIDDCFITDGQTIRSVLNDRHRRAIFNSIDQTNYQRCFTVSNIIQNEIWACYPSIGSSFADKAMVWNWKDDTIALRDIPQCAHIAYGIVNDNAEDKTWDAQAITWDNYPGVWNQKQYNPTVHRLLFAGTNDTKFYIGDETNQEDTVNMTSRIERTGINIGTMDKVTYCRGVYPYMQATGPVDMYVGSQMSPEEAVAWKGPFSFDPRTQRKIDCRVSGRLLAYRVESNTNVDWKLNRFDMDVQGAGIN